MIYFLIFRKTTSIVFYANRDPEEGYANKFDHINGYTLFQQKLGNVQQDLMLNVGICGSKIMEPISVLLYVGDDRNQPHSHSSLLTNSYELGELQKHDSSRCGLKLKKSYAMRISAGALKNKTLKVYLRVDGEMGESFHRNGPRLIFQDLEWRITHQWITRTFIDDLVDDMLPITRGSQRV